MSKIMTAIAAIAAGISMPAPASADTLYLRGKVTLEDGSPPGKMVLIERTCHGTSPTIVATAGKSGEYLWRAEGDSMGLDIFTMGVGECALRAVLVGYHSTTIDLMDRSVLREPRLPVLVIAPKRPGTDVEFDSAAAVPRAVRKAWTNAEKALRAGNWSEAESQLRAATAIDSKFRMGWEALGLAYRNQRKATEARDAYRRAVALDPKPLGTQLMLAEANLECRDWAEASRTAAALIAADPKHRYLNAYLHDAIALYHLREMDRAEARVKELLQLDKARQIPRAEYVLGLILEARQEFASAGEHMRKYLELQPAASDAPAVRARIDNLGKPQAAAPDDEIDAPNLTADAPGETVVPGGLKAFAAIARLGIEPTYDNFFLEYCRQLLHNASPYTWEQVPAYPEQLAAYMATVSELEAAGQKRSDDSVVVTMSMQGADARGKTARILRLFGWTLNEAGGSPAVELGGQREDGLRHPIASALGIDEIAMRDALNAGRTFEFEIRSDSARLVGGIRWAAVLKNLPPFPGGMADVFARDLRFAQAYAGLGAMAVDTALALISSIGVRELVTKYAEVLALCSGAFAVSGGRAATPGGPEAVAVWTKLAGADPAKPAEFFRALIGKDQGKLAVFYFTLSQVDARRQRFFTANAARAQRFYEWYRDSPELRVIGDQMPRNWRREFFGKLPLDESGRVRFPGGRAAWSNLSGTDEEVLLRTEWLEALAPVALLEEKRGAPLDEASAGLLARHFAEWRSLFPYFANFKALDSAGLQALADFSEAASNRPADARDIQVGEWHSLVKLIELGARAGSLDAAAAAQAFTRVCTALAGPDPSTSALSVLREIAGGQDSVDEAVATRLLRLSGPRRADFDRVRELQAAPSIDAALAARAPATTLAALSGVVYAAVLDPDGLLVTEDSRLLSRHRFVPSSGQSVFYPTELVRTRNTSASYLTGGFMTFEEIARGLARHRQPLASGPAPMAPALAPARPAAFAEAGAPPADAVFRASGRLVEVHATVTDGRGRYVDDVPSAEFTLLDDGKSVPIASFENRSSAVSVALLFDATGSMQSALPALKSAALKLLSELRAADTVAVYSFNAVVAELQPFTTDKGAVERAVLRPHALGGTALFDALVRVSRDLAARPGKKAIVVFTDGDDNASTLTAEIASLRAKTVGAPIYTIAQGAALKRPELLEQLTGLSKSTGGLPFAIREPAEILKVFESVSKDLTHGYLLTFQPPPDESPGWHTIKATLRTPRGRTVRAREGYSLE